MDNSLTRRFAAGRSPTGVSPLSVLPTGGSPHGGLPFSRRRIIIASDGLEMEGGRGGRAGRYMRV